jgi:hypothetical protein
VENKSGILIDLYFFMQTRCSGSEMMDVIADIDALVAEVLSGM